MRNFFSIFVNALCGYAIGLFGGMGLVYSMSPNTHDLPVEAAMTGAFFLGPLGACLGVVVAFIRPWRK